MPTYLYKARDATGKLFASSMEADSPRRVRDVLREKHLFIISVEEPKTGLQREIKLPNWEGRPSLKQVALFSRQLATMVGSGIPLVQSLVVMQRQVTHKGFQAIIRSLRQDIEGGLAMSQALAKHPKIFSRLYINLVRAGESSGTLDVVLDRVAIFLEKSLALRGKIRNALTYPTIIIFFAITVTYFLLTTIVPQFGQMLEQLNANLPPLTQFLINFSSSIRDYGPLIIIGALILGILYRIYANNNLLRVRIDRIKLKLPIFGELIRKSALAAFSRTFALLLSNGVNILESLEIVRGSANNAVIEAALTNAHKAIQRGEQMSQALAAHQGVFPAMVISMINVGEETGALDVMLTKIADFYEREIDESVAQLSTAIEPIMIAVLGVIVGLIVTGMLLPMFSIISQLSG